MKKIPIIVVVGPTASGKSEYALNKALAVNGEIISGDSMQIYRGMDIGTAKPSKAEIERVPHHLIDVADITLPFSAARFAELAEKAIEDIYSRGKTPIIAGGTGLYIDTLISGTRLSATEDDQQLRKELFEFAQQNGAEALHRRLEAVDPIAAENIHPNNIKRVARAIEIFEKTGKTKTELDRISKEWESPYDPYRVYICPKERETLYSRIDARVDKMFELGLEQEVRALYDKGLETTVTASQAIGYKEFYPYFRGETDIDLVKQEICLNTRHYAKRQLTWFNRTPAEEIIYI